MVSYYDKLRCAANQSRTPIVAKLEGIFGAIDDDELLKALKGKVHRGCQGYSVDALWHSYLAGYVLGIPTVASLIRRLQSDAALCMVCGLNPAAVPSEATYSRFVARLAIYTALVKQVLDKGVVVLRENLPGFGQVVAVDSSDITAYSQSSRPSDLDAHWAKKKNKHGRDHWWFGYKIHMVCDAEHELPIHVAVTPANYADSLSIPPLLSALKHKPQIVLADAGYDSGENYRFIHDELGAYPIIKLNRRGKRTQNVVPHRTNAEVSQNSRGRELREFAGITRGSERWERLYAKRVSSERLFSRMKEFRRLSSVHHRGLAKISLHCYLSTLTVVASADSAVYCQQPLRKVA